MSDTYAAIKSKIQQYVQVNGNDANLLALIDDAIAISVYEIAREQKWPELLVVGQTLDLTTFIASNGLVSLPNVFMQVERVRFYNKSPLQNWRLPDRMGLVPPAPVSGKPRAYQITEGPALAGGGVTVYAPYSILIEPFATVDAANDIIKIDYYEMPVLYGLSPVAEGGTPTTTARIKSNMWDAEIEKRSIVWLYTYYKKLDQADEVWKSIPRMMRAASQQQQQNDSSRA